MKVALFIKKGWSPNIKTLPIILRKRIEIGSFPTPKKRNGGEKVEKTQLFVCNLLWSLPLLGTYGMFGAKCIIQYIAVKRDERAFIEGYCLRSRSEYGTNRVQD